MLPKLEDYSSKIERLFCQKNAKRIMTFTFQVTTECSLRCTYCYQINKGHDSMTFETAKSAIDYILECSEKEDSIFSHKNLQGMIFDFIGGEPLLCIDLITEIIGYTERRLLETDSPWIMFHRYSFSSNGVAYFDKRVQDLLDKYGDLISMSITVDGCRELHDQCRHFPDGSGSYDIAVRAALDQLNRFGNDATKITLCPENIGFLCEAIKNMLHLGFHHVWANFAYEKGWELENARTCYEQMHELADWLLDNNLEDEVNVSIFDQDAFAKHAEGETKNWCGGTGDMAAIDWKGDFYPCIRYMESSLGQSIKPLKVGSIRDGIYETEDAKAVADMFSEVTWYSQQPDECLDCEISGGCSWCSAYNYQVFGTPNKRATFICIMHKARFLGARYFWEMESKKNNSIFSLNGSIPHDDENKILMEV